MFNIQHKQIMKILLANDERNIITDGFELYRLDISYILRSLLYLSG